MTLRSASVGAKRMPLAFSTLNFFEKVRYGIYSYTDADGKRKQKWETYATKAEAKKRKKEIEYKEEMGSMIIPQCKTMKDLLAEYVALYGKDNWALSTYDGNVSLINNPELFTEQYLN